MYREDFIDFLKENNLHYCENTVKGLDEVYVFSTVEFEAKHTHPRKFKNLYVPYLRVSNFDGDWYVRDNGYCSYMPCEVVLEKCLELGKED